jgi:hypothetical protein
MSTYVDVCLKVVVIRQTQWSMLGSPHYWGSKNIPLISPLIQYQPMPYSENLLTTLPKTKMQKQKKRKQCILQDKTT